MDPNTQGVSTAFARLSAAAAEQQNRNLLRAAQQNIDAGSAQIEAQETEQRKQISRALQKHQGTLRVNAAFRGVAGAPSSTAELTSASLVAAEASANVRLNALNAEAALRAQNDPILEDVRLAAIEGGLRGFAVASQLSAALLDQAHEFNINGFQFLEVPGLDLAGFLEGGTFNF